MAKKKYPDTRNFSTSVDSTGSLRIDDLNLGCPMIYSPRQTAKIFRQLLMNKEKVQLGPQELERLFTPPDPDK